MKITCIKCPVMNFPPFGFIPLSSSAQYDFIKLHFRDINTKIAHAEKESNNQQKKDFSYYANLPISCYYHYERSGRSFFLVMKNTFRDFLTITLPQAIHKFPDSFGKDDTGKVMNALWHANVVLGEEYLEHFYSHEQFCYVFEAYPPNSISSRILRIDLFRLLSKDTKEFSGGLMHGFDHFYYHGCPMSARRRGVDELESPQDVLGPIIHAFFVGEMNPDHRRNTFICKISLADRSIFHLTVYREEKTGLYFIKQFQRKS